MEKAWLIRRYRSQTVPASQSRALTFSFFWIKPKGQTKYFATTCSDTLSVRIKIIFCRTVFLFYLLNAQLVKLSYQILPCHFFWLFQAHNMQNTWCHICQSSVFYLCVGIFGNINKRNRI